VRSRWRNQFVREVTDGRRAPIHTWQDLRGKLRVGSVPTSYARDMHNKLQRLYQRSKSVEEYFKEMEVALMRANVVVDDMVVKSETANEHCKALERVFKVLRKHQLRLNPEKCSFGVQAGKILGFMLTERGIEANPDKCQAVIGMRSPRSIREVQQFMGRVTALSRFISRAADVVIPIFATLKKERNFTWTAKCEEAFLRLKAILATPLVLVHSPPEIQLYVYISVLDTAISTILVQERDGGLGPSDGFPQVTTVLPEFPNTCRIDLPIRMVAWSVQLSEFDISFERRGHIKAQALVDFITELALAAEPTIGREWYLSVDGSSNHIGSGADIILEGPDDILIE
ncbi:Tf2-9, partial [Mucuna pruriens]